MKRRLTYRLGLLAVTVVLITGCGQTAKELVLSNARIQSMLTGPPPDRSLTHTGRVDYVGEGENRITVLYVTGNSYEMGYQQGKLLGPQVKATIAGVVGGLDKFIPKTLSKTLLLSPRDKENIVNEILDRAWAQM